MHQRAAGANETEQTAPDECDDAPSKLQAVVMPFLVSFGRPKYGVLLRQRRPGIGWSVNGSRGGATHRDERTSQTSDPDTFRRPWWKKHVLQSHLHSSVVSLPSKSVRDMQVQFSRV